MIATAVLAAAAALPAAGGAAAMIGPVRRSGRTVTVALGLSVVVAATVLVMAASEPDGLVGGSWLRIDRALALVLLVVLGTATVVASFASRSLDRDDRTPGFFGALGVLVAGSVLVLTSAQAAVLAVGWIVSGWALALLIRFDRAGRRVPAARRRMVRSLAVGDAALVLALLVAAIAGDGVAVDGAAAA
ncbi:MAG: hypothetical protein ACLGHQ_09400, partial [Acidimicrobiia bacterium]